MRYYLFCYIIHVCLFLLNNTAKCETLMRYHSSYLMRASNCLGRYLFYFMLKKKIIIQYIFILTSLDKLMILYTFNEVKLIEKS